jgi:hypothetical protein
VPFPSLRVRASAIGLMAVILAICAGCETRTETREPRPPAVTVWRPMGTWSGRGNSQTGSFTVETGALRLRWETRNESAPGAGRFRVSLHSAISGRPLQVIVDRTGVGSDVSYLEDEPRVSYLVIESEHVDWMATLEEAVARSQVDARLHGRLNRTAASRKCFSAGRRHLK